MNAQARKVVIVNRAAMMQDALYSRGVSTPDSKVNGMKSAIGKVANEREAFERGVERRLADGSFVTGQSADIKHVRNLKQNDAVARLFCALNLDPRAVIFPQSRDGGKSSAETSNLKGYKKVREIAETVFADIAPSVHLENVAKVWTVCAFKAARDFGQDVLTRDFSENFLTSRAFKSIHQGSDDFWTAVDDTRAKHMSTGAQTQTSQMVRVLVALGSATDVRDGRAKNTRIHSDGLVINALMRRFGVVSDVTPEDELSDLDASVPLCDVSDDDDTFVGIDPLASFTFGLTD